MDPKPVVVLVHGGASSGRMYKEVTPVLEQAGFECVAPDLPGHGTSAKDGPFTFAKAVEGLVAVITRYQGRKVLVAGISLGGQVVLALLLRPDVGRVVNAAIVSGASIHPPDDRAGWEMPRMPREQAWLDLIMEDVQTAGWDNMPALQEKSLGFTFEPVVVSGDGDDRAAGQGEDSRSFPPVLVVVGEHDTPMSRRDFGELCEKAKMMNTRSEGKVLAGAAHNHSIDVPELFAQTVEDWFKKVLS